MDYIGSRDGCQRKTRHDLYCKQTWVTLVGDESLGRGFHYFQRFRGPGDQGAELDIPRRWDLRGWGGKMHPADSGGQMVLSSGPVCARPRLPALIALIPEPRPGGGHRAKGFDDGSYPDSQAIVLPMFVDRTKPGMILMALGPFTSRRFISRQAPKNTFFSLQKYSLHPIPFPSLRY
jgi:hypothetical protein